jgi:metal-responsive CopG/Arc/MetJ family transcriptional regulator
VVRASVSFPPDLYESLNEIARRKKVSLAWVIREAAERYASIEQTTPNHGENHKPAAGS